MKTQLEGWSNCKTGLECNKSKIEINNNYAQRLFVVVTAAVLLISPWLSVFLRPVLIFTGTLVKIRKVPNFTPLVQHPL